MHLHSVRLEKTKNLQNWSHTKKEAYSTKSVNQHLNKLFYFSGSIPWPLVTENNPFQSPECRRYIQTDSILFSVQLIFPKPIGNKIFNLTQKLQSLKTPPPSNQSEQRLRIWTLSPFNLFLCLIFLNGDVSLSSTHSADCFSSELTQTRDLSFSPHQLRQTMRGKAWGGGNLSFYISIFARVAGRQSGMSMCGPAASDWCEITVTAAHSGMTNTHTQTVPVVEVGG